MLLTILGSGTSTGVPLIGCKCPVCRSKNLKNKRLRTSAWIQVKGKSFLIDTSTDLREQALRAKIKKVDGVLYTHPHADHIHGIDELRCYNFIQKSPIPIYGNQWTCEELRSKFPYVFQAPPTEGGGIPQLEINQFDPLIPSITASGVQVIPIALSHGSKQSVGYRIQSMAYITDCSLIPPSSLSRLKDLSVLVLDCVRLAPHSTHLNLDQALDIVATLKPKKTYLTHLGHDFDHIKSGKRLPKGVAFAYDGLIIKAR